MTLARFEGEVVRGDDVLDHDFTGRSVAVLAPGASAAAILPHVVATARAVKFFQETPGWVLPAPLPVPGRVGRLAARLHLRRSVDDAWHRRLLTPHRRFGRRGVTVEPDFYRALESPTCTFLAWPVYAIVPQGVRTVEGVEHRVDCLVVSADSVAHRLDHVPNIRRTRKAAAQ